MILVYTDSQIIELEWLSLINFQGPYQLCHDFIEYSNSDAECKIAFTMHRLHCDHDINCPAYQGFEDKINKLSAISKFVFTFESELHHYHWTIWDKCHHDNVYWVVPGQTNDHPINNNIIFWGDWFKTTTATYKELPHKLDEIKPYIRKPRYFDALLGSPKPHRDFIANSIRANNLEDKVIMTYGGQWNDNEFYAKDYFIYEPGTEIIDFQPGTAGACRYHGVHTSLSRIIPIQVFNDTAYSIIAETDHDNTLSFFSEKTAKPILTRRLFVAFTGYKFLQNLRNLGFKTFENVIDESYDLIYNDNERYAAAFEQVIKLCNMDQIEVYDAIKEVVEHNCNLIMSRDWTHYAAEQINKVIAN